MKTTRLLTLILATALLARADVLPPAQDSSSLKGKLTAVTGKATTLAVSATRKGYVLFNLASLPQDLVAADIVNARLRVYFPAAKKPGDIGIHTVTAGWIETTTALEPGISVSPIAMFPAATVVGKKFVEVDVTATVQAWRTTPATNFGFAFTASGLTNIFIGSKEGSGTGYPCELDIEIQRDAPPADGSITAAQLADAAITNAKLASGLTLGGTTTGTFSGDGSGLTGVTAVIANGSIANAKLANSALTVTAGSGLSGGGTVALGGNVNLSLGSDLTLGGTTAGTFSGDGSALTGITATATTANFNIPTTNATGTVGVITQGGTSLIHTFGGVGQNFFAGLGAGNFTIPFGGQNLTGIGFRALANNGDGGANSAMGEYALESNTTGAANTALGVWALRANLVGGANTATGYVALRNSTGSNNTALGYQTGFNITTGANNIVIGSNAGSALTTGSGNITVGNSGVAGESNIIRIGTSQTDTFLTGIIHGNGSGLTGVSAAPADGSVTSAKLTSGLTLGGTTTGTFSGPLTGNVTGDVSGSAASFTGDLAGDVTGSQGVTVVSTVGGVTAANVATGANLGKYHCETRCQRELVSGNCHRDGLRGRRLGFDGSRSDQCDGSDDGGENPSADRTAQVGREFGQ